MQKMCDRGVSDVVLQLLLVFVLLAGCAEVTNRKVLADEDRPNILFAFADDWGWPHAGAYGDPVVRTPTFDRVAKEGVLFQHAYVSSPSCTPSRGAVLTGQHIWRLKEGANLWSTLRKEIPVYPDLLEEAGYHVGYTGKGWAPGRVKRGGRERNPAGPRFNNFSTFLKKRPKDKPFCFWYGSFDPHRPYQKGVGKKSGMDLDKIQPFASLPDVETVRSDIADYYWEVQRFDRRVGRLIKELEDRNMLENTVVVISGDHGMPFPRGKGNLYDTGVRVPLSIQWPKQVKGGRSIKDFVNLTDLAPTFLDLAGVEVPEVMTGTSLVPLLNSEGSGKLVDGRRNYVLTGKERHVPCQNKPESGGTPMRAIRTYHCLYIRNFKPDRWPAGTPFFDQAYLSGSWYGDVDNGPTKLYMIQHKNDSLQMRKLFDLSFSKRPREELYDLQKDPDQLMNVAYDPAYQDVRKRLWKRLKKQLVETDDPRIQGEGDQFDEYPYYGGTPTAPDSIKEEVK